MKILLFTLLILSTIFAVSANAPTATLLTMIQESNGDQIGVSLTSWLINSWHFVISLVNFPLFFINQTPVTLVEIFWMIAVIGFAMLLSTYSQKALQRFAEKSSLGFELIVWVNGNKFTKRDNPTARYLWEIDTSLSQYGLEIPFPQRDLHLKSVDSKQLAMIGKQQTAVNDDAMEQPLA